MRAERGWPLPQSAGAEACLQVLLCFHAIKNIALKEWRRNVVLNYPMEKNVGHRKTPEKTQYLPPNSFHHLERKGRVWGSFAVSGLKLWVSSMTHQYGRADVESSKLRIKAPKGLEAQPESWAYTWSEWKNGLQKWFLSHCWLPTGCEWESWQDPPMKKGNSLDSEASAWLASD